MVSLIWTVSDIARICQRWQEEDYDGRILATGNTGTGKSTLLLKIARKIPNFNMQTDLAFKRKKLMNLLATSRKKLIIGDEMINAAYNRDFYEKEQKDLLKMINMYRDRNNILLSACPNFADLDRQFRASIKIRLHVIRRGLAIVHTPNQTSYSNDPWDMMLNQKIEMLWIKRSRKSGTFKANYKQLTTFRGIIRFGKLPPRVERMYKELKDRERNEIYEEDMAPEEKKEVNETDKIIQMVKEGRIDKDYISNYCLMMDKKYTSFVQMINRRLKDTGERLTYSQLLNTTSNSDNSIVNKKNDDDNKIQARMPVI